MNKNPNMTEPLHNKIAQALLRTLQTGQWRKGQRLPTERDLSADMGCAVGTLRKALAQLENEGLLERVQGRGTFVARVPDGAEYPMFHLELRQGGGQPAAKVIERNLRPCPVGLNNPQHLRRVRYLDDQAVAIEDIWIQLSRPLAPEHGGDALYQTLAKHYGLWIRQAQDHISAVESCIDAPIEMSAPAGFIERDSYNTHGEWVEHSHTYFNTQLARYTARWEQ